MVWGGDGACAAEVELGKGPYRVASTLRRLRARHRVRFVLRSLGGGGWGVSFSQNSQVWLILRQSLPFSEGFASGRGGAQASSQHLQRSRILGAIKSRHGANKGLQNSGDQGAVEVRRRSSLRL